MKGGNDKTDESNEEKAGVDVPILEEVRSVIKEFLNNKAPGKDVHPYPG